MKSNSKAKLINKTLHAPSKSHEGQTLLIDSLEDIVSTMASPTTLKDLSPSSQFMSLNKKNDSANTAKISNPNGFHTFSQKKLTRILKESKSSDLIKSGIDKNERVVGDKEQIIKLQENFIVNLKNEIEILEKEKKIHEQETSQIKALQSESVQLEQKIIKITEAYKKDLRSIKQKIHEKEETIQKVKFESSLKLKEKTSQVEKLKQKIKKLKEESKDFLRRFSEVERFKSSFESVVKEKKKLSEQVSDLNEHINNLNDKIKVLNEENKILVKNYKDVQSDFLDLEKKYQALKVLNSKTTNAQIEITNLLSQFESLNQQNQILTEKNKLISERASLLESENSDLKQVLLKYNSKTQTLPCSSRLHSSQDSLKNLSLHFNKSKPSKDCEIFPKSKASLDYYEVSEPDCSAVDLQMSQLEQELRTIRNINLKLLYKEEELSIKLQKTMKSKNFYQDQTLQLQSRVNELEKLINSHHTKWD